MHSQNISTLYAKSHNSISCPECGAGMIEAYRSNENGACFIWYECGEAGCSGQWLQKENATLK